jgi:hypothetical protein
METKTTEEAREVKLIAILRLMLLSAGFGWSISAFGIFLPWTEVSRQLVGLGAGQLPADPMLNYWLRMTATAFTAIGIFFFILAVNPRKNISMLLLAGLFMLCEGLVLLVYGLKLGLDPIPFYVDTVFCLSLGIGILIITSQIRKRDFSQ